MVVHCVHAICYALVVHCVYENDSLSLMKVYALLRTL